MAERATENELVEGLRGQLQRINIYRVVTYITYAIFFIAVVTLSFRILFLLFSANPATPFVKMIYGISADFEKPFRGIFPPRPVGETGYLDVTALFALMVYSILAAIVKGVMVRLESQQQIVETELYHREGKDVLLAAKR